MSIAKGIMFTVAMRWTDRLIGVVSTIILARLLVPDDFGVVAQATIVIGLITVLSDFGVHVALIQRAEPEAEHYDTSWTLRLIQFLLIAVTIYLVAPFVAGKFDEPRIEAVMRALCIGFVFAGLENIATVTFQKEMRFDLDFRFRLIPRLVGFLVTVTSAFALQSYWAMVIGAVSGRAASALLSYRMHAMRPKLSLARFRDIFAVSQWMLVRGVGAYIVNEMDRFALADRASTAEVGSYSLGKEIAAMPSTELLAPFNRVLFPAFVKARDDNGALPQLFLMTQGIQAFLAVPASAGLAIVAEDVVILLLGGRWMPAVPYIQILSLMYVLHALGGSAGYLLITLGRIRLTIASLWIQIVCFAALFLLASNQVAGEEVALMRMVSAFLGLAFSMAFVIFAVTSISFTDLLAVSYRPLVGTAVMATTLISLRPALEATPAVSVSSQMIVGAVVYTATVFSLWHLAGRPAGAESRALELMRRKIGR